jgi:hypothetical protein
LESISKLIKEKIIEVCSIATKDALKSNNRNQANAKLLVNAVDKNDYFYKYKDPR